MLTKMLWKNFGWETCMCLKLKMNSNYYRQLFFTTVTIFQQLYIYMDNDFHNIFFRKIFAVLCVAQYWWTRDLLKIIGSWEQGTHFDYHKWICIFNERNASLIMFLARISDREHSNALRGSIFVAGGVCPSLKSRSVPIASSVIALGSLKYKGNSEKYQCKPKLYISIFAAMLYWSTGASSWREMTNQINWFIQLLGFASLTDEIFLNGLTS